MSDKWIWQHTIVDEAGNVQPGATITVLVQDTGEPATLWDDAGGTISKANPFSADSDGFAAFFCDADIYNITATKGGLTKTWSYVAIGAVLPTDVQSQLDAINASLTANATAIAANVDAIDYAGEVNIENQIRLFRLGKPVNGHTQFQLDTRTLTLPNGVTLETYFDTVDNNHELLATQVSLLGAVNGAQTAFILDTSTVKLDLDTGSTLASRLSGLDSQDAANSAAITTEATTRANVDSALSSLISLLGASNGAATAFILDSSTVKIDSDTGDTLATRLTTLQTDINGNSASITTLESTTATNAGDISTLQARYGVSLNVNGYVTGFVQNNDGSTGTFDILADKFRVVNPASGGSSPTQVFTISGSLVTLENLIIDGSLLVDGSIAAAKLSVTNLQAVSANTGALTVSGDITVGSAGAIFSSGKSSYASTAAGFFLGYDGGAYKLNIGSAGSYVKWDGSSLTVVSDSINLPGTFVSNDTAGAEILGETTAASGGIGGGGTQAWTTVKTFSVYGTGTVAVNVTASTSWTYGVHDQVGQIRLLKNGSVVGSAYALPDGGGSYSWTGVTVSSTTDSFEVQAYGGKSHESGYPAILSYDEVSISAVSVRATWQLGAFS